MIFIYIPNVKAGGSDAVNMLFNLQQEEELSTGEFNLRNNALISTNLTHGPAGIDLFSPLSFIREPATLAAERPDGWWETGVGSAACTADLPDGATIRTLDSSLAVWLASTSVYSSTCRRKEF